MTPQRKFKRELKSLFGIRSLRIYDRLKHIHSHGHSDIPKRKLKNTLKKLKDLSMEIIIKDHCRKDFLDIITKKKGWRPKRAQVWSRTEKRDKFNQWFERNNLGPNCIYVYWAKNVCQYVGRTGKGSGRPSAQFEKFWFGRVTRIDVYNVSMVTEIPKAECLAFHLFSPKRNKVRPSSKKGSQKCPICRARKYIYRELRNIASFN